MPFTPPPNVPNFTPGVGRLATDRYDFEAHLEGINPPYATNFRHKANQIDMSPLVTISGQNPTNVQDAIALLAGAFIPATSPATTTSLGLIQLSGDISGTATVIRVVNIQGQPISTLPPTTGQVLTWQGSFWQAQNSSGGPPTGFAGGNLSGTYPNPTVIKINGASVPAAGSLVTGNVLQVNGSSGLTYAPINLAGGVNYVTGALPVANLPNLLGDVVGAITSNMVVAIQGNEIEHQILSGAQDGYVLTWNGSEWSAEPAASSGGGSSTGFAVLAGSGITNTGLSVINGNIGSFPTVSETGFPPGIVNGTNHAGDSVTQAAKIALTAAYNAAQALPGGSLIVAGTYANGATITPGVYYATSSLNFTGGTVTLNGAGNYTFQIVSTLLTASSTNIVLAGGATAANVTFAVGSSATLGTGTVFNGNILALTSITDNGGSTINGALLAQNGAVTLNDTTITVTANSGGASGPAGGDLSGTYPNPTVISIDGYALLPLTDGYLYWSGTAFEWLPVSGGGAPTGPAGGDLGGSYPNPSVANIHGASVPIAGSLTTGNVLQVTGTSALGYAAVNLAGGANFVTGVLPAGNQSAQTMLGDVTGTTAASTVVKIRNITVPIPSVNSTVLTYNSGAYSWAAGGGVAPGTFGQFFVTGPGPATEWVTLSGDVVDPTTAGVLVVTGLQQHPISITAPTAGQTLVFTAGFWTPTTVGGGSVTWADDLSGNGTTTSTNQYVSSLSYSSSAAGGAISINGTSTTLIFAANNTNPIIGQTQSTTGNGATLELIAQKGFNSTNGGIGGNAAILAGSGGSSTGGTNAAGGNVILEPGSAGTGGTGGAAGYTIAINAAIGQPAWQLGYSVGNTADSAIYGNNVTPSSTNFTLATSATETFLNAANAVLITLGGVAPIVEITNNNNGTVATFDLNGQPLWQFTEIPSTTTAALYYGSATPSASNTVLQTDGSTLTRLAAPGTLGSTQLQFTAANTFIMSLGNGGIGLGSTPLNVSNTNITLVAAQYVNPLFIMSGTVTGSFTITFPNVTGLWYIVAQSPSFSLSSGIISIQAAGGGSEQWIRSNLVGTNLITIITDGDGNIYASYYN